MYRKIYEETFDFRKKIHVLFSDFLNKHEKLDTEIHNEIVTLRNKIIAVFHSWIGSKKIKSKFGIDIPLHSTTVSYKAYLEKQNNSFYQTYNPCEICGENRIVNYCHILPYSEGGPDHESNYVILCPTHHHLFDHNRLSREEWSKLNFSTKMPQAQEYIEKIKRPLMEKYWNKNEK